MKKEPKQNLKITSLRLLPVTRVQVLAPTHELWPRNTARPMLDKPSERVLITVRCEARTTGNGSKFSTTIEHERRYTRPGPPGGGAISVRQGEDLLGHTHNDKMRIIVRIVNHVLSAHSSGTLCGILSA